MLRTIGLASFVILAGGQTTLGQMPVLDNVIVPYANQLINSTDFVDVEQSAKTVTVPRGKAMITWSLTVLPWTGCTDAGDPGFIRPVVGNLVPSQNVHIDRLYGAEVYSGSWVTDTEQAEVTIKLQANTVSPSHCYKVYGFSWSIVVLPESSGAVPAVSTAGLLALVLLILAAGGLVASRRGKTAT